MNKNIKYLIEDIVNFNPVDYSEEGFKQYYKNTDSYLKYLMRKVE